jgi:hypothetical protein
LDWKRSIPEGSELTRVFAASNCLVSMVAFPSSCPGTAAGEPGAGPGFIPTKAPVGYGSK